MAKTNNADTVVDRLLGDLIAANEQTTEIDMFNHKWTFKMLNAAAHVQAIADSSGPVDRVARLFKLEMMTLKHALVAVDGQEVSIEESEQLFENMPPLVIDRLSDAYEVFRAVTERKVTGEEEPAPVVAEPEHAQAVDAPPPAEEQAKPQRRARQTPSDDSAVQSFADVVPPARG